jgi:hypothetical protein
LPCLFNSFRISPEFAKTTIGLFVIAFMMKAVIVNPLDLIFSSMILRSFSVTLNV